jgi:hypothetical protein
MVSGYQFYPTRQKLSLVGDRKPLEDDTLLKDAGLTEAAPELAAKDLGPQISWKTVFLVEYVRAPVRFASAAGRLTAAASSARSGSTRSSTTSRSCSTAALCSTARSDSMS